MPKKSWNVQLEDGWHKVEFELQTISRKWFVRVDGNVKQDGELDTPRSASDFPFRFENHQGVVHYRTTRFGFDLSIDGRSLWTGSTPQNLLPLPSWTWLYIVACLAIPFFTAMSLVPIMMGVGGAGMCYRIARIPTHSVVIRIVGCISICAVCWLFILLRVNSISR